MFADESLAEIAILVCFSVCAFPRIKRSKMRTNSSSPSIRPRAVVAPHVLSAKFGCNKTRTTRNWWLLVCGEVTMVSRNLAVRVVRGCLPCLPLALRPPRSEANALCARSSLDWFRPYTGTVFSVIDHDVIIIIDHACSSSSRSHKNAAHTHAYSVGRFFPLSSIGLVSVFSLLFFRRLRYRYWNTRTTGNIEDDSASTKIEFDFNDRGINFQRIRAWAWAAKGRRRRTQENNRENTFMMHVDWIHWNGSVMKWSLGTLCAIAPICRCTWARILAR